MKPFMYQAGKNIPYQNEMMNMRMVEKKKMEGLKPFFKSEECEVNEKKETECRKGNLVVG